MKRLLLVCEGPADARTATKLVDRKLQSSGPDWLKDLLEEGLDPHRCWVCEVGAISTYWKCLDAICKAKGVRVPRGTFGGEHRTADSLAARKAVFLARALGVQALILVRDLDDQPQRAAGLEQGRELAASIMPSSAVVLGTANPKREAWVLGGFAAETPAEEQRLVELRKELGFHPCESPHRIAAKHPGSKTDLKRVLDLLTGGELERERRCYEVTALEELQRPSLADCGLPGFLQEVAERLCPLFAAC